MPANAGKAETKREIFQVIEKIWSPRTGAFEKLTLKFVKIKKKGKEK